MSGQKLELKKPITDTTTEAIREAYTEADYEKLVEQATKQRDNLYKSLNDKMLFSVDVAKTDNVTLNQIGLNDNIKSVNRLRVIFDSKEAKKQIQTKYGFSVDSWINRTKDLNPEVATFTKQKINNKFRKVAKSLLFA